MKEEGEGEEKYQVERRDLIKIDICEYFVGEGKTKEHGEIKVSEREEDGVIN